MIRIYASDPSQPDFTLSGVFTPSRRQDVAGYVTLDAPHFLDGKWWESGATRMLSGSLLVVDAETMEILFAPWPTGAKILRGLWAPQWVRSA